MEAMPVPYTGLRRKHNPEKREFRRRSYTKLFRLVFELRDEAACWGDRQDSRFERFQDGLQEVFQSKEALLKQRLDDQYQQDYEKSRLRALSEDLMLTLIEDEDALNDDDFNIWSEQL